MPTPKTILSRRKRSLELANDLTTLRRVEEQRKKNARLFEDRVREEKSPPGYYWWDVTKSADAHNDTFVDLHFSVDTEEPDLLRYLAGLRKELRDRLKDAWMRSAYGSVTFNLDVRVKYYALDDESLTRYFTLTSNHYPVYTAFEINDSVESALEDIMKQSDDYQDGKSSWVVDDVIDATLKYQVVSPSSSVSGGGRFSRMLTRRGGSHIEIPQWISNKKCVINFQNKDQFCFKYAMECAFQHKLTGKIPRNAHRTAQYDLSHFNYNQNDTFDPIPLEFPFHPLDIPVFEAHNKMVHNVAIHVYTASEYLNDISIIRSSTNYDDDAWNVHLLHMSEVDKGGEQTNSHWLYITNLSAFLKNPRTKDRHIFCPRCTESFHSGAQFERHHKLCKTEDAAAPSMPRSYQKWKYFDSHSKMVEQDFVIYADFEAFNVVHSHKEGETITEKNRVTEHVGASFCFHTVCRSNPNFNKTVMYSYPARDLDDKFLVGRQFLLQLENERDRIKQIQSEHFSFPLDLYSPGIDDSCEKCCVCKLDLQMGFMPHWRYKNSRRKSDFKDPSDFFQRLRNMKRHPYPDAFQETLMLENATPTHMWDHRKASNNYIGKAHFACGRWRPGRPEYQSSIPVVFHNLSRYDAHFILKALNPTSEMGLRFQAIPTSGDTFMTFSFRGLRFIDSMKFMKESLDKLSQNLLKTGKQDFRNFNAWATDQRFSDSTVDLLLQKGEFPYEYFDHPRVFDDLSLPPVDNWYSKLKDEGIAHDDLLKAQRVWDTMGCKTFQDYHDLYLRVDTLLLADIFENFRTICLSQHKLDPVNYPSLPGYSMDAAFLFAGSRYDQDEREIPFCVDLFDESQNDMYTFIEGSIRGGVSMCPGRHSVANHKYLTDYDDTQESKYIFYLDANNLYGYAMKQPLPFAGYEWIEPGVVDLSDLRPDDPWGYIFEVDGHFPDSVHDFLHDFPPAPINQIVTEEMISPFSKELNDRLDNKHDDKTRKLLCTLEKRESYVCYYTVLQLYVKLGFVITKIKRVLKFRQSTWLADYVQFNTDKRAQATNAFEKDFYKLLNNSGYGKLIQNNRKHRGVKALFPNAGKMTWSPYLLDRKIINKDFVLGYMKPTKVNLNSPVGVGTVVLDHSKYLMYNFYYNVMKKTFDTSLRLLFTDTDSLCMEIAHPDPMTVFPLNEWFDLNEYPEDDSYYGKRYKDNRNKKVIGKFKDEMVEGGHGVYIKEVVALRSKMYSCLKSDGKNKNTAKGVSWAAKRKLVHEKYLACLTPGEGFKVEVMPMTSFQTDGSNVIHTITVDKATLSPCDSKLYLVDATTTHPFGYYKLRA